MFADDALFPALVVGGGVIEPVVKSQGHAGVVGKRCRAYIRAVGGRLQGADMVSKDALSSGRVHISITSSAISEGESRARHTTVSTVRK